ncbi:MAG: ATP-binding protein [Bacteroidetes bacterium]|nr:ATP-binding protein [Bacteroidota bacterium]
MDIKVMKENANTLFEELLWLEKVIATRMALYWNKPAEYERVSDVPAPDLSVNQSPYARIIEHYNFGFAERVMIVLALAPHIQPQLLDVFYTRNDTYDKPFAEFGGLRGTNHHGFIPTGETAAFILAAQQLDTRFYISSLFGDDHPFKKFGILNLTAAKEHEPFLSGVMTLSAEYLNYFTLGDSHKPDFSTNFPAKRLTTACSWEDLVLDDNTLDEVNEIRDWITHGDKILNEWGLAKVVKPGYRALFYGPPGTGKTLTAALLGKVTGLDVYRIDLSMVVSKYIGETEKNLANVFDQAQHKNWILFFDEADSLFGKRTQTSSSNDRYANQEVSYLLQRIEDFPGVVILATNLKANIDEAFSRRFQNMIFFAMPGPEQRETLWKQAFGGTLKLDEKLDIKQLAQRYELAGGAIINVARYGALMAARKNATIVAETDVLAGARKEIQKDGKV